MCVTSMVVDRLGPSINEWTEKLKNIPYNQPPALIPYPDSTTLSEIKKLIEDFRSAFDAASKVDKLTGQPDCVDPEKAKLFQRVAELENRILALEKDILQAKSVSPEEVLDVVNTPCHVIDGGPYKFFCTNHSVWFADDNQYELCPVGQFAAEVKKVVS
jgi:hypothetical protein